MSLSSSFLLLYDCLYSRKLKNDVIDYFHLNSINFIVKIHQLIHFTTSYNKYTGWQYKYKSGIIILTFKRCQKEVAYQIHIFRCPEGENFKS